MINAIDNLKELTDYYNQTKDKKAIKKIEEIAKSKFRYNKLSKHHYLDQFCLFIAFTFYRGRLLNHSQIIEEVTLEK